MYRIPFLHILAREQDWLSLGCCRLVTQTQTDAVWDSSHIILTPWILVRLLNFSRPQFSHLCKSGNNNTHLVDLWRPDEIIHVKCWECACVHRLCSVNIRCDCRCVSGPAVPSGSLSHLLYLLKLKGWSWFITTTARGRGEAAERPCIFSEALAKFSG